MNGPMIIAVNGGKGGVGKSNIAANLSIAFTEMGYKTLMMEMEQGKSDTPTIMGAPVPRNGFGEVIKGRRTIEEVLCRRYGLDYLPGVFEVETANGANYHDQTIEQISGQLGSLGERYQICVIDSPAGIDKYVVSLSDVADETFVVTNPEPAAMDNALRIMNAITSKNLGRALGETLEKYSVRDTVMAYLNMKQPLNLLIAKKFKQDSAKGGREYAHKRMKVPLEELTEIEEVSPEEEDLKMKGIKGISQEYHSFILEDIARAGLKKGASFEQMFSKFSEMGYSMPFLANIAKDICKKDDELKSLRADMFQKVTYASRLNGFNAEHLVAYCVDRLGMNPLEVVEYLQAGLQKTGTHGITPFLLMKKYSPTRVERLNSAARVPKSLTDNSEKMRSYCEQITALEEYLMGAQKAKEGKQDLESVIISYARSPERDVMRKDLITGLAQELQNTDPRNKEDYAEKLLVLNMNRLLDFYVQMSRSNDHLDQIIKGLRSPDVNGIIDDAEQKAQVYKSIISEYKKNEKPIRIIMNMAKSFEQGNEQYRVFERMVKKSSPQEIDYGGTVCEDDLLEKAIMDGDDAVLKASPDCEASKKIKWIAGETLNRLFNAKVADAGQENFGSKLLKIFGVK